ncbi:MAG: hypothetical protein GX648_08045 [Crenarchaeota archaeon]|nr:hypothetical protein [Thermoproteota archaeon]
MLQQSEWMNGFLNQLVDWLEKAASNDLLNYDQGWEPMRNDDFSGFMLYDIDKVLKAFIDQNSNVLINAIDYEERGNIIVTGSLCDSNKKKSSHALYILTESIIDNYLPNFIVTMKDLCDYCVSIGISDIKSIIERNDKNYVSEDKLFVILSVKRPANIIGSEQDIEFLHFVIQKDKHRKKKNRELKRIMPECKVSMLTHISERSQSLLKRLSGTQTEINESKNIALIGCGSLGSKIGMHLTRNGNGPFLCIDDDIFMPHNNARHALTLTWAQNKAELLALSMFSVSRVKANAINKNAFNIDYADSRIIIDTTASLSVRNFLMSKLELPPVISGGLYNKGQYGILFVENKTKTSTLSELWAFLYFQALENIELRKILFSGQENHTQIGQSCSSQTMIVDDSKISLYASMMSLILQEILESSLPKHGNIYLFKYSTNYSLITEVLSVPENVAVHTITEKEWQVSLAKNVHEKMIELMNYKSPNETGGVLLGTVLLYAKKVVITGLIPAPPDSIEKPNIFKLGTEGLEKNVKDIEKKTNGKVTYLGTWHSHPQGGSASQTDNKTFKKLLFVRNYEPTVCLIVTPNEVLLV